MVSDMQICCVDIVGNGFVRSADTGQTHLLFAEMIMHKASYDRERARNNAWIIENR